MIPIQIPVFDLKRQWEQLGSEFHQVLEAVGAGGGFILGERVKNLEAQIAQRAGVQYGCGVGNGSDGLFLALEALGVGPGDEVITSPFTFFATAGAIARCGATPVFVDVDSVTYNIDPDVVEAAITPKTKAILPVHLYGQPADMGRLKSIAERHELLIVEDAAQALGAALDGRPVGSWGDATIFSFFPTKNLGALGDGGIVVTNRDSIHDALTRLRAHGSRPKYYHDRLGINSRLDELQAGFLLVKLGHLDAWTAARRRIASRYSEGLKSLPIQVPVEAPGALHVYHQYTIRVPKRDEIVQALRERGVGTAVYYPLCLHLQKVFAPLGYGVGSLPVAEQLSQEVVSLPMFPELTDAEIAYVCKALADCCKGVLVS